jgi:hypothetical protein
MLNSNDDICGSEFGILKSTGPGKLIVLGDGSGAGGFLQGAKPLGRILARRTSESAAQTFLNSRCDIGDSEFRIVNSPACKDGEFMRYKLSAKYSAAVRNDRRHRSAHRRSAFGGKACDVYP